MMEARPGRTPDEMLALGQNYTHRLPATKSTVRQAPSIAPSIAASKRHTRRHRAPSIAPSIAYRAPSVQSFTSDPPPVTTPTPTAPVDPVAPVAPIGPPPVPSVAAASVAASGAALAAVSTAKWSPTRGLWCIALATISACVVVALLLVTQRSTRVSSVVKALNQKFTPGQPDTVDSVQLSHAQQQQAQRVQELDDFAPPPTVPSPPLATIPESRAQRRVRHAARKLRRSRSTK